jgi:ABC-type lipoprotein export system ATPase subunit
MSKPLLVAEDLRRSYLMGRSRLDVLRGCSLSVQPGEFVAIMGKSGSGKSTLLHLLGALDAPQAGEIQFDGEPMTRPGTGGARTAAVIDRVFGVIQFVLRYLLLVALPLAAVGLVVTYVISPELGRRLAWLEWVVQGLVLLLPVAILLLFVRLGVRDLAEQRRTGLRRRALGFVFQFYHLLPELNVLENTVLPWMVGRSPWRWLGARREARAAARRILDRVGLAERLKHKPAELSGGERQRVALARALVHSPRLLLADEPTGNLDAESGRSIMELLAGLHREGQTIIMVTHDAALAEYADRVLVLEGGRLRPARAVQGDQGIKGSRDQGTA